LRDRKTTAEIAIWHELDMDIDRSLLFGVLAVRVELIDSESFLESCRLWALRKDVPLADILIELGWITLDDKLHLDYLVERKVENQGGDARVSLGTVADEIKHALTIVGNGTILYSPADTPKDNEASIAEMRTCLPSAADRYELIHLHATGGIGRIWFARDHHLGRDVALKELQPRQFDDPHACARFLREAQITGQLEHPGVVPVYDLVRPSHDSRAFYTMRFVKGRTLSEATREFHQLQPAQRLDSPEFLVLLNAFVAVCNTIAYTHSRGILHRDLKGQNVVLGNFGEVEVLDWGLAKCIGEPEEARPRPPASFNGNSDEIALTAEGQAVGTPAYMAPEQASGCLDRIDQRTDVYGLGAMLYEILTGGPPFRGSDIREVLCHVLESEPIAPTKIWFDVPLPLEAACLRALAKDSKDRFGSPSEFGLEVQRWQEVRRKQAEKALQESEALYHSLVETIPMNVWRKDVEGRFVFGNKGFCEKTKRTLADLIGKTDFDLFPVDAAEKYRRDDSHVLATGETFETIEEHSTADGEKLYVHVIKLPVRDTQGNIVGTQGIFADITDRERLKQTLERGVELVSGRDHP